MTQIVLLDTGVLGLLVHPKRLPEIRDWAASQISRGATLCVPEIADYELRRELLRLGFAESVGRLDQLCSALAYLRISTRSMRLAAALWAEARSKGRVTAGPKSLDGDLILAAQARRAASELDGAASRALTIVATTNVGHLTWFVDAREWRDIN